MSRNVAEFLFPVILFFWATSCPDQNGFVTGWCMENELFIYRPCEKHPFNPDSNSRHIFLLNFFSSLFAFVVFKSTRLSLAYNECGVCWFFIFIDRHKLAWRSVPGWLQGQADDARGSEATAQLGDYLLLSSHLSPCWFFLLSPPPPGLILGGRDVWHCTAQHTADHWVGSAAPRHHQQRHSRHAV